MSQGSVGRRNSEQNPERLYRQHYDPRVILGEEVSAVWTELKLSNGLRRFGTCNGLQT